MRHVTLIVLGPPARDPWNGCGEETTVSSSSKPSLHDIDRERERERERERGRERETETDSKRGRELYTVDSGY